MRENTEKTGVQKSMAKKKENTPPSADGYNWAKIRSEYVTTKITYRQLCEKYGCSMSVLTKKASSEKWAEARKKHRKKVERKTEEKVADRTAEKNARDLTRCYKLANGILDKVEKAIGELDKHILKTSKVKSYSEGEDDEKVYITENDVNIKTVKSTVKTDDLKRLSAALKDVRDVLMSGEDEEDKTITVVFEKQENKNYGA